MLVVKQGHGQLDHIAIFCIISEPIFARIYKRSMALHKPDVRSYKIKLQLCSAISVEDFVNKSRKVFLD